jgi:hypothetical protein
VSLLISDLRFAPPLMLLIVIDKKHQTSKTEHRTLNIELLNRLLLIGRWMFGVQRWAFASTA